MGLIRCCSSKRQSHPTTKMVKLSQCFINQAPHHEDKWGYSSICLNPSYGMSASGQVHTLVILHPVRKAHCIHWTGIRGQGAQCDEEYLSPARNQTLNHQQSSPCIITESNIHLRLWKAQMTMWPTTGLAKASQIV